MPQNQNSQGKILQEDPSSNYQTHGLSEREALTQRLKKRPGRKPGIKKLLEMNLNPDDFVTEKKPPTAYILFSKEFKERKKQRIKEYRSRLDPGNDSECESLEQYAPKMPASLLNKML